MLAIFDLDGVLVKTDHMHTSALRAAVKQFVSLEASQVPYLDARDGVRTIQKLKRLQEEFNLRDQTVEDVNWMKTALTRGALRFVDRNVNVIKAVQYLKDKGWKLAVASNSRRDFVNSILSSLQIDHMLDLVVCGDEVSNPKPHPEIFLTVMERMGVEPSSTVIFEDSPSGLKAAHDSGAKVIQVDPDILLTLDVVKGA